jgi:hypothetical protein
VTQVYASQGRLGVQCGFVEASAHRRMLPKASNGCRLTWPSGAAMTMRFALRDERKPPVVSGFVPSDGLMNRPSLLMSHRGALPVGSANMPPAVLLGV